MHKIHKSLIVILLTMAAILISAIYCTAQTFTNTSKPYKVGNISTSQSYTLQFTLQTDTGFHKLRSVNLWEAGSQRCYISYPYLVYNGVYTLLSGKAGYTRLADKKPHRWTFRIGDGRQEVLLDSILIASTPYFNAVVLNADLWLSSSSDIDKLSGTITDLYFTPTLLKLKKEIAQPVQVLDARNLPVGLVKDADGEWDYTNVKPLYTQLSEAYDRLKLTYPANAPKIHPMFDFLKCGGEDWGVPIDSAIRAGVAIAKLLCDKGNCDFRVIGNTTDYMSYYLNVNSPHGKFNQAMIDAANANPSYELRVDCSLSHLDAIGGYTPIYTAQVQAMLPNEPITTFDAMAQILFIHYSTIQAKLNRPIKYALVDNEYFNNWLDTSRYALNTACNAAKIASGLSWWDYCSSQYAKAMNRMYDGINRACPGIEITEYDANALDGCQNYYFPKFKYRVQLNTNRQGSEQLYPREPINVLSGGLTSGDKRGLLRYQMLGKRGQIKEGVKLSAPFYGMGYLGNPDIDINQSMIVGLETFVTATGSPTAWPALFVDGGNNPNPKSYAGQMYSMSIAQASCSKVWDIITTGDLLPGDRSAAWQCFGGTNYTFWFGDYETAVAVMKKGNLYSITTYHTSMTNLKLGINPRIAGGIWLNGKYVPLEANTQSFVYLYDENKPITATNPIRVNGLIQLGLVENWK